MLGEKIRVASGQVTTRRVLPSQGGGPRMETSFEGTGTMLGIDEREVGTYTSVVRPDGSLFGHGQGVIMGTDGSLATWVGQGVGTVRSDGAVSYRGALCYESASPSWVRLNTVAGVFEFEVDARGNTRSELWEWK
ncbi:MAG TPA: hypothetical protein VFQ38_09525 [Longimicrobiales bacterium]|nr:hypothetical protein [Longimicrobiales bacterium]